MSRLTATRYRDLAALLGDALDHPVPQKSLIGTTCGWPVGIYVLGHPHPVSNGFDVDYVGSACRSNSDMSDRIREHLRDADKRERFTHQVVLPLRRDLPLNEVRRLEGVVARALGVPRWCRRVPGGTARR